MPNINDLQACMIIMWCEHVLYLLLVSLTGLRPSMTWSNIMGGGFTDLSSVHRKFRLRHYITFRNTRRLFLIHLQLVRPPPLIPKLYSLLLPRSHDFQGSWPPLFHRRNVKIVRVEMYWSTLLWRRLMYSPIIHIPTSTRASPMGGNHTVHSDTEESINKSTKLSNYAGPPTPTECGVLWTKTANWKSGKTGPPTHITSQVSWCWPPTITTGGITAPMYSELSGG